MQIRKEIKQLMKLGPLPNESAYDIPDGLIENYETILNNISQPISTEEAIALIKLLPPNACFGLETQIIRLLESTKGWPIYEVINLCPSPILKATIEERAAILK